MPTPLSDSEIDDLIAETKRLPERFNEHLRLRSKRGHKEAQLDVIGENDSLFGIVLRQNLQNSLDFTAILTYLIPNTNVLFRLRRYNGKSHEHTNRLERERFYDFHIHMATERYQLSGLREDAYAQPTHRYSDLSGALTCLLEDGAFIYPDNYQIGLPLDRRGES
jgi:hypothetical protein